MAEEDDLYEGFMGNSAMDAEGMQGIDDTGTFDPDYIDGGIRDDVSIPDFILSSF